MKAKSKRFAALGVITSLTLVLMIPAILSIAKTFSRKRAGRITTAIGIARSALNYPPSDKPIMTTLDSKKLIQLGVPNGVYVGPFFGLQRATILTNYDGEITHQFVRDQFTEMGLDIPDFVMGLDLNMVNDEGQKTIQLILISRNMVFHGKN